MYVICSNGIVLVKCEDAPVVATRLLCVFV